MREECTQTVGCGQNCDGCALSCEVVDDWLCCEGGEEREEVGRVWLAASSISLVSREKCSFGLPMLY